MSGVAVHDSAKGYPARVRLVNIPTDARAACIELQLHDFDLLANGENGVVGASRRFDGGCNFARVENGEVPRLVVRHFGTS